MSCSHAQGPGRHEKAMEYEANFGIPVPKELMVAPLNFKISMLLERWLRLASVKAMCFIFLSNLQLHVMLPEQLNIIGECEI